MLKDITIKTHKKITIENFADNILDACNDYLEVNYEIDSPEQSIVNYNDLLITVFEELIGRLR